MSGSQKRECPLSRAFSFEVCLKNSASGTFITARRIRPYFFLAAFFLAFFLAFAMLALQLLG
jgi:hypothetical protein